MAWGANFLGGRTLLGAVALSMLLHLLCVDWNGGIGECNNLGKYYHPLDFDGEERTVEASWQQCADRCNRTTSCAYFNFWPDGGCHISKPDAVPRDAQGPVIAGPPGCLSQNTVTQTSAQNVSNISALDLWRIDGAYYDFSSLLNGGHPGGAVPLMKTRGTDVSVPFKIQHLSNRPRLALEKYRVRKEVLHEAHVGYKADVEFSFDPDGFYETLKQKVHAHLNRHIGDKSPRKATSMYVAKLGANVVLFLGSWLHVNLYQMSLPAMLANAVSRMVLTGMAHDAMHGILVPDFPLLQKAFSSIVLRSFLNWEYDKWTDEHIINHHPYTKSEHDPDENRKQYIPVWRLTNATPWTPWHSWPMLSHTGIGMFVPILNGIIQLPRLVSPWAMERVEPVKALATIISWHLMPLICRPWREGIVAVALTSSLAAFISQVAFHGNHLAEHLEVNSTRGVDWGEHQMRTTTNFISHITGTLDLQIEHHLFPMLSYENQRLVSPIVQQTAKEFGIPYNCYDSASSALIHHMSYMAFLGRGENANPSSPDAAGTK